MTSNDYRISSNIRQNFFLPKQSENLDLSFKTDLDLYDCLEWVKLVLIAKFHRTDLDNFSHSRKRKTPSYSRTNMVIKTLLSGPMSVSNHLSSDITSMALPDITCTCLVLL